MISILIEYFAGDGAYLTAFDGRVHIAHVNLLLVLLALGAFCVSYLRMTAQKGRWASLFHIQYFLVIVLPVLAFAPFACSLYNRDAIGDVVKHMRGSVSVGILVSCVGALAVWLGRFLANRCRIPALEGIPNAIGMVLSRGARVPAVIAILCAPLVAMVVLIAYYYGLGSFGSFNVRGLVMTEQRALVRPVFNFVSSSLVYVIYSIALVNLGRSWNWKAGLFAVGACVLTLATSGSRSAILIPVILFGGAFMVYKNRPRYLVCGLLAGFGLLAVFLVVSALRSGETDLGYVLSRSADALMFGNEFSDMRDFGWIIEAWDGAYKKGITYLAALFSFVPSEWFPWRKFHGVSWVLTGPTGLMDAGHAGLRPGPFGEAFINFGLPGVTVAGVYLGYVWTLLDHAYVAHIRAARVAGDMRYLVGATLLLVMVQVPLNTSGAYSLYSILLLLAVVAISTRVLGGRLAPHRAQPIRNHARRVAPQVQPKYEVKTARSEPI